METTQTHPFLRKEVLGTICCATLLLMSVAGFVAYVFNQKVEPSQIAVLITPLVVLTGSFFGMRAAEGYYTTKLSTPATDDDGDDSAAPAATVSTTTAVTSTTAVVTPVSSDGPPPSGK